MSWFVTGTSESASGSTSRTSLPCEATRIRGRLAIAHTTQGTRTLPHHRGMLGVLDGLHEINVRVLACQRQEAATHAPAGSVDRELDRHCSARGQAVSALPERFGSSHEHAVASRASRHARTTPTHTTCRWGLCRILVQSFLAPNSTSPTQRGAGALGPSVQHTCCSGRCARQSAAGSAGRSSVQPLLRAKRDVLRRPCRWHRGARCVARVQVSMGPRA